MSKFKSILTGAALLIFVVWSFLAFITWGAM